MPMNSQINYQGSKRDRDQWVANNANTAVFIQKTYDMISRCDPNVACWSDAGDLFIVKDSTKLAKMHIPRYFDHSNFSSFSRQLNFYGFRKINNLHETDGYTSSHVRFHHEYFQRERPDLLSNIKRSTLNNSNSKVVNKEIENLKLTVTKLEEKIKQMSSDFETKMKEMYDMIQQQQQYSRPCAQCCCPAAVKQEETQVTQTEPIEPATPRQIHSHLQPPMPKRIKLENPQPIIKQDDDSIAHSDITTKLPPKKETNFERQQSVQSTDFLSSLINDEMLNPSGECADIPFNNLESDQLLSFPERGTNTRTNALPPLPTMPEIGIIRFLSDLSASRATSIGDKETKVSDLSVPAFSVSITTN